MSSYSDFAFVYDELMCDADYNARTEYVLSLFEKYGKRPTLLLDLACGTGTFSNLFAKKGIEVIGADMSQDMLSVAREKMYDDSVNVLYLCQKAEELDLYGTIDGAVCLMDSLNHITDEDSLEKAISRVSLFMEKDGLFIFDVNTPYKHKTVLGNNTFVKESDEVFCVWQNEYVENELLVNIRLDIFSEADGLYERFCEEFSERAYDFEFLKTLLSKYDFEVLAVFDDLTENEVKPDAERAFFVCKKTRQTNGF